MSSLNRSKSPVESCRSPGYQAWASPLKTPTRSALANSSLFNDSDFSPLSNASWAEMRPGEQRPHTQKTSQAERRNRKPSSPKRAATRPKFARSLELESGLSTSSGRREQRGRNEERTVTTQLSRKRHLSNTSTIVDGNCE
ncbi:hypothetical protein PENTCL1PPCAC_4481, partial [Pristionchus entomophagus]